MVCLDALVYELKSFDQGDGKNQVQRGLSLGSSPGIRYLDDSVGGVRVPIQVQRREDTGQGKGGSMDSRTGFVQSRASGQPHAMGR